MEDAERENLKNARKALAKDIETRATEIADGDRLCGVDQQVQRFEMIDRILDPPQVPQFPVGGMPFPPPGMTA